jgi:ATP-binding cassette subfamily A (ABC1) protein 3
MSPFESNLIMLGCGTLYLIVFYLIDSSQQIAYRSRNKGFTGVKKMALQPDDDVIREEEHVVDESSNDEYLIKGVDLCKKYPNGTVAACGNTFGIKKNEIFGLLGPNGAGKSTTFSMLTMKTILTDGKASVMG